MFFGAMFAIASVLSVFLYVGIAKSNAFTKEEKQKGLSVLLIGEDDVAGNTDTLLLLWFNPREKAIQVLQIPRDIYIKRGETEGKINGIYPEYIEKYGKKEGAERLTQDISALLGISVDRYLAFQSDGAADFIDAIGGVEVDVPFSMQYSDEAQGLSIDIPKGKQMLSGEQVLGFWRYRQGYTEGDIGRLDMQMLFLSSMAKKCKEPLNFKECLTIYQKIAPKVLTNLQEKDIISFVTAYIKGKDTFSFSAMRLVGEACTGADGKSYYVLNRSANEQMLNAHFASLKYGEFDAKKQFFNEKNKAFWHIYEDKNTSYRVYALEEMEKISVKRKG